MAKDFGGILDVILVLLGAAWIHLLVPWGLFWVALGHLGVPWAHLGVAWDPLGTSLAPFRCDFHGLRYLSIESMFPGVARAA